MGYFPMAENRSSKKINFYKPEKRFIIPINLFHIPKKLLNEFIKKKYKYVINHNFNSVIENCSKPRKKDNETWINNLIKNIYNELNIKGFAHSIECYDAKSLVAGLYGVHIGGSFFGESMFSKEKNASKFCLLFLISILFEKKFKLLDSQFYNKHLLQFGAYEIANVEYQIKLNESIKKKLYISKKI